MKEEPIRVFCWRALNAKAFWLLALLSLLFVPSCSPTKQIEPQAFELLEATIEDVHEAYRAEQLTCRQLVQLYLDRIEAYDKNGPAINSIITLNSKALEEADKLDAAFKTSGFVGPLHGIPVILKDQVDAQGMPTTLGSVLLKDYYPEKDAFVVEQLKKAGAIILAKATLGEFAGGGTYGSLFGVTRNPYDLDRTVGGSSGGTGASISANFATVGVGQEGLASLRRPSAWNCLVGIRTTAGLISRTGVYGGTSWPSIMGSLGPMARTVKDLATLLDVMVGYDPEDPYTALSVGNIPSSYTQFLDKNGLKEARIGVLRESMGLYAEPDSEDFLTVTEAFNEAIEQLKAAGVEVVDPIVIPNLKPLLAKRASGPERAESIRMYFGRNLSAPFKSVEDILRAPDFDKVFPTRQQGLRRTAQAPDLSKHYEYLLARQELMINVLKVMADHHLDAIVHKSVEHQPNLISEGTNPPYVAHKGAPHLNTFLVFVPTVTVPAGFTQDELPFGVSFLGRPFSEGEMIKLAYAYEQATLARKPPSTVPPL